MSFTFLLGSGNLLVIFSILHGPRISRYSLLLQLWKMVLFHSHVRLPENIQWVLAIISIHITYRTISCYCTFPKMPAFLLVSRSHIFIWRFLKSWGVPRWVPSPHWSGKPMLLCRIGYSNVDGWNPTLFLMVNSGPCICTGDDDCNHFP